MDKHAVGSAGLARAVAQGTSGVGLAKEQQHGRGGLKASQLQQVVARGREVRPLGESNIPNQAAPAPAPLEDIDLPDFDWQDMARYLKEQQLERRQKTITLTSFMHKQDNCFSNFATDELEAAGLRPHPDKIAETTALASVPVPPVSYKMSLPVPVLACPGVGKGRQIAAAILENFAKGRTKAVWLSACGDLLHDVRRDLADIGALGYEGVRLLDLKAVKAGQRGLSGLPGWDKGILFLTYDLLISGEAGRTKRRASAAAAAARRALEAAVEGAAGGSGGQSGASMAGGSMGKTPEEEAEEEFGDGSRLAQLVEWCGGAAFDGLLVLDECHKAKNCLPKDAETSTGTKLTQKESKTSRAVVELQRRCRDARVLYVSATGATESENLCYMERLGLWGPGTAYPGKQQFVTMLKTYGVRAMELVAMELKQNGSYLARTLSYEGVKFEMAPVRTSDDFRDMYDGACGVWQQLQKALMSSQELEGKRRKEGMGQFYGAQLRFFKQLCTAGKVDEVERLAKEALARGQCVVIGLQSTGESRTAAYVAANGGADTVFDSFSFETSAQEILLNLMRTYLPSSAATDELEAAAKKLRLPKNPLDDLIQRLGGPGAVAEMTGRNKRMEAQEGGGWKYVPRNHGCSMDAVNLREKEQFQAGTKLVAIISDAASTGISLQADRSKPNTRQRVHITLELAWSADKTAQPPLYVLVSSDVAGEHRFASAVAARLMQLGALTHGDRNAVSAVDVLSGSNFHTTYGPRALSKLYRVFKGVLPHSGDLSPLAGITPDRSSCPPSFIAEAVHELEAVGLLREDGEGGLAVTGAMMKDKAEGAGNMGGVNRLLNRLLGVRVDMQRRIFQYFTALLDFEVQEAKRAGTYESGIVRPTCGEIRLKGRETIYMNPDSRITTSHFEFSTDRGVSWEAALRIYEKEAIERNERGRKVQGRGRARTALPSYFRLVRPGTGYAATDIDRDTLRSRGYRPVSDDRIRGTWLKTRWKEEYNRNAAKRQQPLHLVSGSLLPLLPTLDAVMKGGGGMRGRQGLQVMRVCASDGSGLQVLGIHVEGHRAADVPTESQQSEHVEPDKDKPDAPAAGAVATAAGGGAATKPAAAGATLTAADDSDGGDAALPGGGAGPGAAGCGALGGERLPHRSQGGAKAMMVDDEGEEAEGEQGEDWLRRFADAERRKSQASAGGGAGEQQEEERAGAKPGKRRGRPAKSTAAAAASRARRPRSSVTWADQFVTEFNSDGDGDAKAAEQAEAAARRELEGELAKSRAAAAAAEAARAAMQAELEALKAEVARVQQQAQAQRVGSGSPPVSPHQHKANTATDAAAVTAGATVGAAAKLLAAAGSAAPTRDSILAAISAAGGVGVTAPELELVDEFEVMREGAGAASSCVDVGCAATRYLPL
eukprot:XP_001692473.1 predicted protein [Chlamydomonas reinhardtii]